MSESKRTNFQPKWMRNRQPGDELLDDFPPIGPTAEDLAAQPEPANDTIDPEAWAALLRVSGAYSEPSGVFSLRRNRDGQWVITIRPTFYRSPAVGMHANINTAIRAAVAKAEKGAAT